jgi:predicted ATP-grasp superfamily ATP-dependent carboligase
MLHDSVKRAEDIHHEVEKNIEQVEHTLDESKRRRRAG